MRYCENCKKFTGAFMTPGQIATASLLLFTVIGFILYIVFHERKCNTCKGATCKVEIIKEEIKANGKKNKKK